MAKVLSGGLSRDLAKVALDVSSPPSWEEAKSAPPIATTGVDFPVPEYFQMQPYWQITSDLYGGTPSMRTAGETYLPKFSKESTDDYKSRLDRTFLFPGFRRSVKALTGFPFSKAIEREGQSSKIDEFLSDVDLQDNPVDVWSQSVFEHALREGHTHILVDMPSVEGSPTNREIRDRGIRPYLKHLTPDQVIGWKYGMIRSLPVLTQLRIREIVKRDKQGNAYEQEFWERIRVYDLTESGVAVSVYQAPASMPIFNEPAMSSTSVQFSAAQSSAGTTRGGTGFAWELIEGPVMLRGVNFIPIHTFYTNRTSFLMSKPPLIDLAYANIEHWQSTSDQNNLLHFARVPRMAFYGWDSETPINFDSSIGIKNSDVQAKAEWIELDGKSIEEGRNSIKDIEERMAVEGVRLLKRETPSRTATEATQNRIENMSELGTYAMSFSSILQKAVRTMALFAGEKDPGVSAGTFSVYSDFGLQLASSTELTVLMQSRIAGEITHRTFLKELRRREVLDDSVDIDAEVTASEREHEDKLDSMMERQADSRSLPSTLDLEPAMIHEAENIKVDSKIKRTAIENQNVD